MPIRRIRDTDVYYYLVVFDEKGRERREPDGTLLSETVRRAAADTAVGVTDIFFTSHGWKGDVPAAVEQYDAWIGAMESSPDRKSAGRRAGGFVPLIVGLHWPSLPWGDEEIPTGAGGGLLSAEAPALPPLESRIDTYAARIADTPEARDALRTILEEAERSGEDRLSAAMRAAYQQLFAQSGLESGGADGEPGSGQEGFDPDAIIEDARATDGDSSGAHGAAPAVLSIGGDIRDALLMPLRQLSFWKMKDRARRFGESGAHDLLVSLQQAAPVARFHLMGHSFGCIVVSATVAAAENAKPLPRPVDSLFLVQGALSLWSFAAKIPYAPEKSGYFVRIVREGLVRGPIVTTRSIHDTAVGRFYPLGAKLKRQYLLDAPLLPGYPKYGGIGAFGIQGSVAATEDMVMRSASYAYEFRNGLIYNLEASEVIKNGGGASGAHSDIAHPEVAHAFWAAILGGSPVPAEEAPGLLSADPEGSSDPGMPLWDPGQGSAKSLHTGDGESAALVFESYFEKSTGSVLSAPAADARSQVSIPSDLRQPVAAPLGPQPAPSPQQQRWFNASLEDQPPDEPLVAKKWYTLVFDVDVLRREESLAAAAAPVPQDLLFSKDTDEVELTVQLDSADFDIAGRTTGGSSATRPLRLPRVGRSRGKARFDISPLHDGPSTVKATFHKDGNFIQQMEITVSVGGGKPMPVEVTNRGRPTAAVQVVRPRDVGISISPAAGAGYDCVVWGSVLARARLNITQGNLTTAVDEARRELLDLVMYRNPAGSYVFQSSIDISDAHKTLALQKMARAGGDLFRQMFFGPGSAADSWAIGNYLRRMASDQTRRLRLQIVAESTPVPWGLLYVGDTADDAPLDWDNFLGMRHVIELIPLQNTLTIADSAIPSRNPSLAVSVNVNNGIDAQMRTTLVADQTAYWQKATTSRKYLNVTARAMKADVVRALRAADTTGDQIIYFYCHAASAGLNAVGGPYASRLLLTDGAITLGDLNNNAPTNVQFRGSPLVFINACESADLSPAFYDGFVPYFMAKGARGVVGTECKTPALFASIWAQRFFERFLDGESLGEAFLNLRRQFLANHGNPLGLLYAVYCDADTQIAPPLAAGEAVD